MHLGRATTTYTRIMEGYTMWLDKHRRLIADIFFILFVFWMAFLLLPQMMAQPWVSGPDTALIDQVCEVISAEDN